MSDQASFEYEYHWTEEIEEDFRQAFYASEPSEIIRRNYWWIIACAFLAVWGAAKFLAVKEFYPSDELGLVLKAAFAGFVAALIPTLIMVVLQQFGARMPQMDDARIRVCVDASGCRSDAGKSTCFASWESVSDVIEVERGVVLVIRPNSALPIFDRKLYDASARVDLMQHINAWRKAAQ